MRFLGRFYAAIGIGLCSILYLVWILPSSSLRNELPNVWSKWPRRLIVFGDSWSDNGQYPIDPPSEALLPSRDPAQGRVWTEWLCMAVGEIEDVEITRN